MNSTKPFTFSRIVLLGLGLAASTCAFAQGFSDRDPDANVRTDAAAVFAAAQRAEAAGDSLNAYLLYFRAAQLDPTSALYVGQREAMRSRMEKAAYAELGPDPATLEAFRITTERLAPSQAIVSEEALPPPRLEPPADKEDVRHTFDLRGDAKTIFDEVGPVYGLVFIFSDDYQDPGEFVYRVNDADWRDALRVLEVASNSFVVPLGGNVALVYRDQQQNRDEMIPTVAVAIPIPERISVQEAQEIAAGVQQTMDLQRIAVDAGRRLILIRDTEVNVMGARKIISDLSRARAQVSVEIELISVANNSSLRYGLSLPTSNQLTSFSTLLQNAPSTAMNMVTFGGGQTMLGLGISSASAFAAVTNSASESALKSQTIALDGQQVTFNIGDRYPVITGQYAVPNNPTASTPQVQFINLGLQIEITSVVHTDEELTLTFSATNSVITGTAQNNIPIIANREFNGTTRMKFGEWAVIAGLTQAQASNTWSGFPLLSQIPWIGRAFRDNTIVDSTSDILLIIKPRLVSQPPWAIPSKEIYVGTESTPVSVY